MEATERINEQALAIFAHELREPLAAILFAVQAMGTSGADDGSHHEMCKIAERQSRYAARMIDEVLEVCRAKTGKACLRKEWFDLAEVVAQAVETTCPLLTRKGHHLVVSLPDHSVSILADPLRVQQVVVNLLANAAKYTSPGGFIGLSIEAADDLAVIEVRDNGVGIPPTLLLRIFDLFHQGKELPKAASPGLGIGLALVKSLVELHGGSVSAHSDGVGAGAAFMVRLPGASPRSCHAHHREDTTRWANAHRRPVAGPMSDA